jgi:hypothetical protein
VPVAVVEKLEGCVQEEGEDVHRGHDIGQVAFSMSEVVFETIPPDFQCLDVLVFDLPPCPTGRIALAEIAGTD